MKIVFLTYVNRSGSTYLANLLSASDDICVCPEGDILVSLFLESPGKTFRLDELRRAQLKNLIQSDNKLRYWGIEDHIFTVLEKINNNMAAFLAFLRFYQMNQKPEASFILFKAERLAKLFYAIEKSRDTDITFKYLSLIRDPRGVYESQKRTLNPETGKSMSSNPVYTAMYWNQYIRAITRFQKYVGCYPLLYHDFIMKMDEKLNSLSAYLGLDLTGIGPGKGDLIDRLPDVHRQIHQSISEIPEEDKIEAWKKALSREEISLIEKKCKKYFGEFGMLASPADKNIGAIKCKMNYFTILYSVVHIKRKATFHLKRIFKLA